MGMYNLLFGKNPYSGMILSALNLTEGDIGRFRDCWTEEKRICIYTRLGGNNRKCYCTEKEIENHSDCYRRQIEILQSHPLYLEDKDDSDNSTYATFYFQIPNDLVPLLKFMEADKVNTNELWANKLTEIKNSSKEEVRKKYPQLTDIIEKLLREVGAERK